LCHTEPRTKRLPGKVKIGSSKRIGQRDSLEVSWDKFYIRGYRDAGSCQPVVFPTLGRWVIDFIDAKGPCPRRLTERKRIKSRPKDCVLLHASFNALREAILSVSAAYQKTRAPLFREWVAKHGGEPLVIITYYTEQARRN
jgi:hypothetical protein